MIELTLATTEVASRTEVISILPASTEEESALAATEVKSAEAGTEVDSILATGKTDDPAE